MSNYLENFLNFDAITTLASSLDSSQTSFNLDDSSFYTFLTGVPNDTVRIRIDDELMLVTGFAVDGNDIGVIRGIENTASVSHNAGTEVYPVLTKAGLIKRVEEGSLEVLTTSVNPMSLDDSHFTVLFDCIEDTTVNLPSAVGIQGRSYTIKKVDSNNYTVIITPDGTEEIDGQTSIILYIQYDFIKIQSDGTNWMVVNDGIQPHMALLRNTSAQSIASGGAIKKVEFNTIDYDNASLASTANDQMTIRRGGVYRITGFARITNALDAAEEMYIIACTGSGTNQLALNWATVATTNQNAMVELSADVLLSAGDVLELYLYHNEGSSVNLAVDTYQSNQPRLGISEVRGGGHASGGAIPLSEVLVHTPGAGAAGQGTTNTKIRRYSVQQVNVGTAITFADSATLGSTFTINEDGLYFISRTDGQTSGAVVNIGISKNSTQLTTEVGIINVAHRIAFSAAFYTQQCSTIVRLSAGDVLRAHDWTTVCNYTANSAEFHIIKIGN